MRPALVPDRREVAPQRPVLQDRVALELVGEQLLRERHGVVLGRLVEAGPAPGGVGRLQDERGVPRVVAIGVDSPEPVHVLLEDEGECRERERRAEPHEPVGPPLDPPPEVLGVPGSDRAVDPVGGEDQVRVPVRSEVVHLRLELELDAELGAPALEDVEEPLARHPGEAVAGRGDHGALVVNVDVVPVGEGLGDLVVGLGIGPGEVIEGRVGEDDAEAEGVVGAVPLDDGDVVAGIGLLHERSEVEPGRTPADADDPQPPRLPRPRPDACRGRVAGQCITARRADRLWVPSRGGRPR